MSVSSTSKPALLEIPRDQFVQRGSISLTCKASGDPSPSISWYNADTQMRVNDHLSESSNQIPEIQLFTQEGRLYIPKPRKDYEYRFYCNASNVAGWVISPPIRAGAAYLDKEFGSSPMDVTATVGDTVRFQCKPPHGMPHPTVMWLKNDRVMDIKKESLARIFIQEFRGIWELHITSAQSLDEGRYVCVAENILGRVLSATGHLIVREKVSSSNQGERNSKNNYQEKVVREGDRVVLKCPIREHEFLQWRLPQVNSDADPRFSLSGTSLTIDSVRLLDSGTYICKSLTSDESTIRLSVEAPPNMLQTPEDRVVDQGSTVVFHCVATGYPKPDIYWDLPNDISVFPQDNKYTRFQLHPDGRLEVRNVNMKDSGKYRCTAHNSLSNTAATATLVVRSKHLPIYPIITEAPQNQTVILGTTLTLACKAMGTPAPVISYYKSIKGKRISLETLKANPRYIQPTAHTLQILDAHPIDSGNFTCVAESDGLQTFWNFNILVVDPRENQGILGTRLVNIVDERCIPSSPYNVAVLHVSGNRISLSWSGANSTLHLTNSLTYQVEMEHIGGGTGWKTIQYGLTSQHLDVTSLEHDESYRFVIRARSSLTGCISPASEVTYNIRTGGRDEITPLSTPSVPLDLNEIMILIRSIDITSVTLFPLSSSKVRIDWSIRGKVKALRSIGGYRVRYQTVPLARCMSALQQQQTSGILLLNNELRYCSLQRNNLADSITKIMMRMHRMTDMDDTERKTINVTRQTFDSTVLPQDGGNTVEQQTLVLKDLLPFRCYSIDVETYSVPTPIGGIIAPRSGGSTESLVLTDEDIPSEAPQDIQLRWRNESSALLSWKTPLLSGWNGVLLDYLILVFNERSEIFYRQFVNITNNSSILENLNSHYSYFVHMAARNCKGTGVRSRRINLAPLVNNMETTSPQNKGESSQSFLRDPWFILVLVLSGFVILLVIFLLLYKCCFQTGTKRDSMMGKYNHEKDGSKHKLMTALGTPISSNIYHHQLPLLNGSRGEAYHNQHNQMSTLPQANASSLYQRGTLQLTEMKPNGELDQQPNDVVNVDIRPGGIYASSSYPLQSSKDCFPVVGNIINQGGELDMQNLGYPYPCVRGGQQRTDPVAPYASTDILHNLMQLHQDPQQGFLIQHNPSSSFQTPPSAFTPFLEPQGLHQNSQHHSSGLLPTDTSCNAETSSNTYSLYCDDQQFHDCSGISFSNPDKRFLSQDTSSHSSLRVTNENVDPLSRQYNDREFFPNSTQSTTTTAPTGSRRMNPHFIPLPPPPKHPPSTRNEIDYSSPPLSVSASSTTSANLTQDETSHLLSNSYDIRSSSSYSSRDQSIRPNKGSYYANQAIINKEAANKANASISKHPSSQGCDSGGRGEQIQQSADSHEENINEDPPPLPSRLCMESQSSCKSESSPLKNGNIAEESVSLLDSGEINSNSSPSRCITSGIKKYESEESPENGYETQKNGLGKPDAHESPQLQREGDAKTTVKFVPLKNQCSHEDPVD